MIHLLPRIWWCPTGPLSFLPLHAAGIYRGEGAENISDYAVSSYTTTVTSLTQRVKNDFLTGERVSGLFLTCQPVVPHFGAIHGTKEEVRDIHKGATALGVRSLSLEGDAVTPEKCLEYMEEYSSIHLACHGFQDTSDILRSRFLFHKGPLPLSSIMQKNLMNADLAYLSACQTSAGQETLADEVVHLAAGMLAAGYHRVVSTMWEIGDGHAPQVASDFYQYLWKHRPEGSGSRFDGSLSAYALHYATQELRGRLDNTDRSLLAWMPFVHYGY
jgi:CHAT domain-containing protein